MISRRCEWERDVHVSLREQERVPPERFQNIHSVEHPLIARGRCSVVEDVRVT